MENYLIDYSDWFDEGGSCQVYPIKDKPDLVFKEFRSKRKAQESYRYQKLLSKFDLSPQLHSKVCRLGFAEDGEWKPDEPSDWGYITELATHKANTKPVEIQKLVDNIYEKTGLKFWDCHWYNVGIINRSGSKKLVCIDTGKESFDGLANAWGNSDPGPKCSYCSKYNCKCEE